jgi:hypothetical protein
VSDRNGQPPHPLQLLRWISENAVRYGATPVEVSVLVAIACYLPNPRPTWRELQHVTGWSEKTIDRATAGLRDLGLLTWSARRQGSHEARRYQLDERRLCVPPDQTKARA